MTNDNRRKKKTKYIYLSDFFLVWVLLSAHVKRFSGTHRWVFFKSLSNATLGTFLACQMSVFERLAKVYFS